jgi:hypothetical protein
VLNPTAPRAPIATAVLCLSVAMLMTASAQSARAQDSDLEPRPAVAAPAEVPRPAEFNAAASPSGVEAEQSSDGKGAAQGTAEPPVSSEMAAPAKVRAAGEVDEVKAYLWAVYQRSSTKTDSHGDFTWKDAAAAEHAELALEDYVIGGMDPAFREQLYAAGQAMDAAGVEWTMLSGFRDDFRQNLASGFKAHGGYSFHGGSVATGGYGHGCAVDLASSTGLSDDKVWNWLDQYGRQFGLLRPLRAADPAHVQPVAGWHVLAAALRNRRQALAAEADPESAHGGIGERIPQTAAEAAVTEEQFGCTRAVRPVESAATPAEMFRAVRARWVANRVAPHRSTFQVNSRFHTTVSAPVAHPVAHFGAPVKKGVAALRRRTV